MTPLQEQTLYAFFEWCAPFLLLYLGYLLGRGGKFSKLRRKIMKLRRKAISIDNVNKCRKQIDKLQQQIDRARLDDKITELDRQYLSNILFQALHLNVKF